MSKSNDIEVLLFYIKRAYPHVRVISATTRVINNKTVWLVRGKEGKKTVRFLYGEDYTLPQTISSSDRKRVGRGMKVS